MATPILGIAELANGQVDQFATANEMVRSLESATQDFLSVDFTAGNVTVTAANFKEYFLFVSINNTVARDFTVQPSKRFFAVNNTGSATLSIKLGSTTLTLAAGASGFYYCYGTTNGLIKLG